MTNRVVKTSNMNAIRPLAAAWGAAILLSITGCASVFDAPYVEISLEEEPAQAPVSEVVELEPGNLHELIAHPEPDAKTYADVWVRMREGFKVGDLDKDPRVLQVARRFAADHYLEKTSQRASEYLFYVVEEISRRRLPMELALVPFVESGYNLGAKSQAEAHGAWQFIEKTGRTYELNIDRFRDDRRSLVASTRAALDYLSFLNGLFNNWPLAMAAYNCGEKRIQAEIDRARARGIKNPGFNDLAAVLPVETREYVPRILALKKIIERPADYKVSLIAIPNEPRYSVVELHRDIDLSLVIQLSGLSATEFNALNPALQAPLILSSSNTQLLLPHHAALRLSLGIGAHTGPWVSWRLVRITRPAGPGEIARRNNVPVRKILAANPLPEGHVYAPGSTLILPLRPGEEASETTGKTGPAVLTTRSIACEGVGCASPAAGLKP